MPDIDDIWDDDEDMIFHGFAKAICDPAQPEEYKVVLDAAILEFAARAKLFGAYMPSLATYLRIHADELADRYPDDTNGG